MEHLRTEQARDEPTTPPILPATSTEEDGSSSERVPCVRSLQELYEVTENQENLTLLCLFTDCEPMNFQKAVGNKNWKDAIHNKTIWCDVESREIFYMTL